MAILSTGYLTEGGAVVKTWGGETRTVSLSWAVAGVARG